MFEACLWARKFLGVCGARPSMNPSQLSGMVDQTETSESADVGRLNPSPPVSTPPCLVQPDKDEPQMVKTFEQLLQEAMPATNTSAEIPILGEPNRPKQRRMNYQLPCGFCGMFVVSKNLSRHMRNSCIGLNLDTAANNSGSAPNKLKPATQSTVDGSSDSPVMATPAVTEAVRIQMERLHKMYQADKKTNGEITFKQKVIQTVKDKEKLTLLQELFSSLGYRLVTKTEWEKVTLKPPTSSVGVGQNSNMPIFGLQLVNLQTSQ